MYRRPSEYQKNEFAHLKPYDRTISYQDPKGEFLITRPSVATANKDPRSNTVVSNSDDRIKEKSASQNKPLDTILEENRDDKFQFSMPSDQ